MGQRREMLTYGSPRRLLDRLCLKDALLLQDRVGPSTPPHLACIGMVGRARHPVGVPSAELRRCCAKLHALGEGVPLLPCSACSSAVSCGSEAATGACNS